MFRATFPAAALALGLGAASAFIQPAPAQVNAPDASTAERTMEQSRRVLIGAPSWPAPSGADDTPAKGAPPANGASGRADPATGTKAGQRR